MDANVLSLEKYLVLDNLLPAFRFKDLQTVVTILHWLRIHGYTETDLRYYVATYPVMKGIQDIGYFAQLPTPEHSRKIKEFEKTLAPEIRRPLRAERLRRSGVGAARP